MTDDTSATARRTRPPRSSPGLRVGLRLRHRAGVRAQGPQRRHRPLHLGQEERARVDARLAAQGLSRLARDGGGQLGQARHPRDRLPGRLLLRRAQGEAEARVARRGRSRNPARLRKARHSDRGAEGARRRRRRAQGRGRRGVRQRQRRHHLPRGAEEGGRHLPLASPKRSASIPSWSANISARVVPQRDNYFACLNSAVFSDGTFVYVPEGVRCPMELSHLFPHQCREYRPVRAHPDRRRQGQLRLLPRRLHRADARREPAARGGGRDLRARGRRGEILDRPELVSGRRRGQGRHLQLRHQARAVQRATARRSAGPRSRPAARSPGNIRAAS